MYLYYDSFIAVMSVHDEDKKRVSKLIFTTFVGGYGGEGGCSVIGCWGIMGDYL